MYVESHVLGMSIFSVKLTVDYKFEYLYTENVYFNILNNYIPSV